MDGVPPSNGDLTSEPPAGPAKRWELSQIDDAVERHERRGLIFRTTYLFAVVTFLTFLTYVWVSLCNQLKVDHLLVWLLAALPVGLFFFLAKMAAEPKADQQKETAWPEGLVAVASDAVSVVREWVDKVKPG